MSRAVCPGSFDPVTHGHLDVIERTSRLVDEVVVAVGNNMAKNALFSPQERVDMLGEVTTGWSNVQVMLFDGLLVEADRWIAQLAGRNAEELGLVAEVRALRVETLLARRAARSYDIVFADPPYELASDALDQQLALVWQHGWVAEDGLVVVERSRRTPPPSWPDVVADSWSRTYGETIIYVGRTS